LVYALRNIYGAGMPIKCILKHFDHFVCNILFILLPRPGVSVGLGFLISGFEGRFQKEDVGWVARAMGHGGYFFNLVKKVRERPRRGCS
jgi:hypothetical protein